MRQTFLRTIRITTLLLVLAAALLFGAFLAESEAVASADTVYDLGYMQTTIYLTYGAEVNEPIRRINGEDKYYRIKSFNASAEEGGTPVSLTEAGRVTALPGTYYMLANGNAVPCYFPSGSEISGANCIGTLLVEVAKNEMTVYLPAADLTKVYGALGEKPSWTDGDLTVTFDSDGLAPAADVRADYPLTLDSVRLLGVERKEYYKITPKVEGADSTAPAATYAVTPKEVVVDYDTVDEVRFNDYLLADGVGVTTREIAGANGDTIKGYFRLKEEVTGALVVGENYEVELYRYEVIPAKGETRSYSLTDPSNYSVSATYTATVVKAKTGSVIVYQDETLREEREGDAGYLYLPPSTFTYTYFDLIMNNVGDVMMAGETLYPSVTFYTGVTGTVRFSVQDVAEGDIPVGRYEMTLLGYDCPEIESLSFEHVFLHVESLVIEQPYADVDKAEIAVSNTFERTVTRTYNEKEYVFKLTADLTDKTVGDEFPYASLLCETDPNVTIDYGDARVKVVKRHTDVTLFAESAKSVPFGSVGALAELRVDGVAVEREGTSVLYRYRAADRTNFTDGLPSAVGSYVVSCSLESDLYEADPVEISLTITKRRAAVLFRVSVASKTYGETFAYRTGSSVWLEAFYPVDEAGNADREQTLAAEASTYSVSLTSLGFAATADVGSYDFDASRTSSANYEIVKYYVRDASTGNEVTKFKVNKAFAPPTPEFSVRATTDRKVKVTASGRITARIANNEEMRSPTELSGEGSVTFSTVASKKPLYGEVFYVSVRAEASANYENASEWSEAQTVSVSFPAPDVNVSSLRSDGAEFSFEPLTNAVDGYVLKYRVGSGEWKGGADGASGTITVGSLRADSSYTLYFRAEKGEAVGEASSVQIRTLRAPVSSEKVTVEYDRATGVLEVSVEDAGRLEYCLCTATGEEVAAWSDSPRFDKVAKDGNYILKVRYVEDEESGLLSSEITEIAIDTHKPKVPFSWRTVLSDWFLAIVGGVLVVSATVFILIFVRKKRKIDREEA
ncbi:MAG: fibronectin type III domain-containing protein [Clostridia bacterium]|nr:fibronectin type III domain-containing protein [Clostridia bacterium]